jgi:hypothetical protein
MGEPLERIHTERTIIVQVDVDVDSELSREIEDNAQVSVDIAVDAAGIDPAHALAPKLQGPPQQPIDAWTDQEAVLRKRDELHPAETAQFLPDREERFDSGQAHYKIYVNVGAHSICALTAQELDQPPGPDRQRLRSLLNRSGCAHPLKPCVRRNVAGIRLLVQDFIQMEMRVDKRGKYEAAQNVPCAPAGGIVRDDRGHPAVFDGNIPQPIPGAADPRENERTA